MLWEVHYHGLGLRETLLHQSLQAAASRAGVSTEKIITCHTQAPTDKKLLCLLPVLWDGLCFQGVSDIHRSSPMCLTPICLTLGYASSLEERIEKLFVLAE